MNILAITHNYYPENNAGIELYVHALLTQLSREHNVMLYSLSRSRTRTMTESGHPYRIVINSKKSSARKILGSLEQCIRSFNPDVVHIHHLMNMGIGIPLFLQKQNIPYVITLHDYWFLCPRVRLIKGDGSLCNFPLDDCAVCEHGKNRLRRIIYRHKQKIRREKVLDVLRNAACLITPSQLIKKRFLDYGVHNGNFEVSQLGINTDVFGGREKNVADRSAIRTGFIGTLSTFKGVDVLIKAFRLLHSDAVLYLYGKILKGDEKHIKKLLQGNRNAEYKGMFDHKDISQILGSLDILVVPSVCEESHALVVDEARAAGIPVIASAVGAIPERIKDGVNGFLVEPRNAEALKEKIQWVIDNYDDIVSRMNFTFRLKSIQEDAACHEIIYRRVKHRKAP